jgi:hypothetical protein
MKEGGKTASPALLSFESRSSANVGLFEGSFVVLKGKSLVKIEKNPCHYHETRGGRKFRTRLVLQ